MKWVPLSLSMLLSVAPLAAAPADDEAKISIDVKDSDVVDIVRLLAEVGDFQVVVDPGINCKLTMALKQVRWVTALDLALKSCGLAREEDGGVVRIGTAARLTQELVERRKLAEERALGGPLRLRTIRLSYARAADVAPIVQRFLSPRGSVFFDARTNTLFIQDVE